MQKPAINSYSLDYTAPPTLQRFHQSKAFVRGIRGPIGSGKSVGMCIEIFRIAQAQAPSRDGIRRTRHIVARNTLPQLETTTIKTWLDWFPEHIFGRMTRKPPYNHTIKINDIEMEVIFLALDKPEDVKKLLSLETTTVWFNEAREMELPLINAATGRVGRYPSKKEKPEDVPADQWPTQTGVIMDTNPPDDSHWWYRFAEENAWAVDEKGKAIDPESVDIGEKWEFFSQPSGLSAEAENIENLPQNYYQKYITGKTKEEIDVYVHGKYGFLRSGRPVYEHSWNDDAHTTESLEAIPGGRIYVGLDFGLTPCAIYGQKTARGQWQIIGELITDDMDLPTFARLLRGDLNEKFAGRELSIFGDPSGGFREGDGRTAFDMLKPEGIVCRAAPTNKFNPRRDCVIQPLLRMVDGQPGFLLSKKGCPILRRGFNGGYKYKQLQVSGEAKYTEEPDKNRFSHPHDALQYLLAGGGEYRQMLTNQARQNQMETVVDDGDWDIF